MHVYYIHTNFHFVIPTFPTFCCFVQKTDTFHLFHEKPFYWLHRIVNNVNEDRRATFDFIFDELLQKYFEYYKTTMVLPTENEINFPFEAEAINLSKKDLYKYKQLKTLFNLYLLWNVVNNKKLLEWAIETETEKEKDLNIIHNFNEFLLLTQKQPGLESVNNMYKKILIYTILFHTDMLENMKQQWTKGDECPICTEIIEKPDDLYVHTHSFQNSDTHEITSIHHKFHKSCMFNYCKHKSTSLVLCECPICSNILDIKPMVGGTRKYKLRKKRVKYNKKRRTLRAGKKVIR